jgi:putative Mg2+ transporter-C (MgtC) family protein
MTVWEFVYHIVAAMLCGALLGFERQWRQHAVGFRTDALICGGAALFVSIGAMVEGDQSPTRIASQVVVGIGFLGGGSILKEGLNIKGMTTAATIWATAAIGSLCGFGFVLHAAIGTGLILFVNAALHPVSDWIAAHAKTREGKQLHRYRLSVTCSTKRVNPVRMLLLQHIKANPKLVLQAVEKEIEGEPAHAVIILEFYATEVVDHALEDLVALIQLEEGVGSVRWEKTGTEPAPPPTREG